MRVYKKWWIYNETLPYQVFDPLVGLSLRVDEERPSSWELNNYTILDTQIVFR